jgi:hypothetical protein
MESLTLRVCKVQGTDSGDYLFIARVCPAAGEPDLNFPTHKNGNIELSVKRMNKHQLHANRLLSATKKGKGNQRCRQWS